MCIILALKVQFVYWRGGRRWNGRGGGSTTHGNPATTDCFTITAFFSYANQWHYQEDFESKAKKISKLIADN